ncbi:hypothetical protein FF38_00953, partial [Lucilia cuprina]
MLISGYLHLTPSFRVLEWLVRRFQIQVHNVESLFMATLPWHESEQFVRIMDVVYHQNIPQHFRFLINAKKSLKGPSRSALVRVLSRDKPLLASVNSFQLKVMKANLSFERQLVFWCSINSLIIMVHKEEGTPDEAADAVLPVVSEVIGLNENSQAQIASYIIFSFIASQFRLSGSVVSAARNTIVNTWNEDSQFKGLALVAQLHELVKSNDLSDADMSIDPSTLATLEESFGSLKSLTAKLLSASNGNKINEFSSALIAAVLEHQVEKIEAIEPLFSVIELVQFATPFLRGFSASLQIHAMCRFGMFVSGSLNAEAPKSNDAEFRFGLLNIRSSLAESKKLRNYFFEFLARTAVDTSPISGTQPLRVHLAAADANSDLNSDDWEHLSELMNSLLQRRESEPAANAVLERILEALPIQRFVISVTPLLNKPRTESDDAELDRVLTIISRKFEFEQNDDEVAIGAAREVLNTLVAVHKTRPFSSIIETAEKIAAHFGSHLKDIDLEFMDLMCGQNGLLSSDEDVVISSILAINTICEQLGAVTYRFFPRIFPVLCAKVKTTQAHAIASANSKSNAGVEDDEDAMADDNEEEEEDDAFASDSSSKSPGRASLSSFSSAQSIDRDEEFEDDFEDAQVLDSQRDLLARFKARQQRAKMEALQELETMKFFSPKYPKDENENMDDLDFDQLTLRVKNGTVNKNVRVNPIGHAAPSLHTSQSSKLLRGMRSIAQFPQTESAKEKERDMNLQNRRL